MLSIQHMMLGVLEGELNNSMYMASIVFPDAIRAYSGKRELSHFERNSDGSEVSYWSFPTDIKSCTKESVEDSIAKSGYLAKGIIPASIGELSDVETFIEHNKHLQHDMYLGCLSHMIQDVLFDDFIREIIDCSQKYNDIFVFDGVKYNGKSIRLLIGEIEQQGIYILAHELYNKYGIVANQTWLEENIKPILDKEYSEELSEKTFKFMKIDENVNELITNKDWSHLNDGKISYEVYMDLYSKVLNNEEKLGLAYIKGLGTRSERSANDLVVPSGRNEKKYEKYLVDRECFLL